MTREKTLPVLEPERAVEIPGSVYLDWKFDQTSASRTISSARSRTDLGV
jgi:hypothetical protein